ncbi:BRO family protein [Pseudomonas sp. GW531-R1]|uniref:BRO-N domain-containing protein n=1 Tax=Pseudomonas sp. GW531-R1 TaxID=2075556 RepID=UPI0013048BCB|nr:BRO family protein [Pseudomonas sp. GW531-R1]
MQFEKRNSIGIELDILTGHPEQDLLFVATQVARAAGLKNASHATWKITSGMPAQAVQIGSLPKTETLKNPSNVQKTSWLTSEEAVYQMLLRGHAPASEPFRKWVTEEVLPTIRKTGKYNAEESTNPIAQGVMDELKTLRGEVGELKSLIEILMARPATSAESSPNPVSTYLCTEVHTEFVWRHFDRKLLIKLCDMQKLSVPVADKLKAAVMVKLEVALLDLWNATDARKLQTELSGSTKRPWARFPLDFLKKHMNQEAYLSALEKALNEYLLK